MIQKYFASHFFASAFNNRLSALGKYAFDILYFFLCAPNDDKQYHHFNRISDIQVVKIY